MQSQTRWLHVAYGDDTSLGGRCLCSCEKCSYTILRDPVHGLGTDMYFACGQLRVNIDAIGCLLVPTMAFVSMTRLVVSRDKDQAPDRKRDGQ